jgi:3'(2'), 5'-bisphosphate nucleotidase
MASDVFSNTGCEELMALARAAGSAILEIYNRQDAPAVQIKSDASPVTAADLAAHDVLMSGLPRLLNIPIISEEGALPEFAVRNTWESYWLIDPLDGTKEFIHRNGEFTVNIALIQQGVPVLGVVYVPTKDVMYLGINSGDARRAIKYAAGTQPQAITVRSLSSVLEQQMLTAVVSHRHGTSELDDLLARIRSRWSGQLVSQGAGSSLKFCLVAEGSADFYPRLAPTSEWDTAAAQAILEAAGGAIVDADEFMRGNWRPLRYNLRSHFENPGFFALGDPEFSWSTLLSIN